MAFLVVYDAAAADIQGQTIRRPFLLRISKEESVSRAFHLLVLLGKMVRAE